ncbi:cytochrome P450 [Actinomadura sp. CNU-125]|uniref:cytochrome P450 n=1 Tax=Actinomadura sp. CNU-125 TaxID=1904961 RepID=UPI0021CC955C|nr:cytochrome P450 [Actinomadura sp. CNU-125]
MTQVLQTADFLLADAARLHSEYARLRGAEAVHRVTLRSGETAFLVTGFEAARRALTDPRLRGRTATVGNRRRLPEDLDKGMNSHMLNAGPPDHTRLRRLVAGAFTRRRMERLRPRVQAITDELLTSMARHDEADFMRGSRSRCRSAY